MDLTMQRHWLHQMINQLPDDVVLDLTQLIKLWQFNLKIPAESPPSLEEVVAYIQTLPQNLAGITWAIVPLDETLTSHYDAAFDVQSWNEQWAMIESQMNLQESTHAQIKQRETWTGIY